MPIIVECPSCTGKLRVPDDLLGQLVKCPTCGTNFTATAAHAEEPPPPPGPEQQPEEGEPWAKRPEKTPPPEEEEEEAPRRRRSRRRAADEDEEDEEDRRPRAGQRPGKVQAIAIMVLVGGIYATVHSVISGAASGGFCCLWPGLYYGLVLGILAIVKGSALVGQEGHLQAPPKGIAVMQIINIINGDIPNCVMGIISLIFLNEPEVSRYYRG